MSETRALTVGNFDLEAGVLRFEDGFTTYGGHAVNKGRRVRSSQSPRMSAARARRSATAEAAAKLSGLWADADGLDPANVVPLRRAA